MTTASQSASGEDRSVRLSVVSRGQLAALLVQLGLILALLARFEIESRALFELTALAAVGFVVHALLPLRWRLPFFTLLSLAGLGLVVGPVPAAWLVAAGLGLLGLCHLPVAWALRGTLLVVAGVGLALARSGRLATPVPAAIWPLIGAFFMFRLLVYVYDLRHEPERPGWWTRLAYFFLLPNVCFPLFPVVDFKTFRRSYYQRPAAALYQNGLHWMLRGLLHLLCYRLVYHHLVLAPDAVASAGDLARFVVASYLLYLRVSGQFHFAVGMLQLFGFALPETHHRYFLAASFNDFWRRINIYWKDFMMKLFYYPAFFRLQRLGLKPAVALATVLVFALTWLLHSYQWFWLLGSFPLTAQDALFWGLLGLAVLANSLRELRPRRPPRTPATARLLRGLRTAAFFPAIALLWSFWTSESIAQWLDLWRAARVDPASAWWLLPLLAGLGLLGAFEERGATRPKPASRPLTSAAWATAAMTVLLLLTAEPVISRLGGAGEIVTSAARSQLNDADLAVLRRGYYEKLTRVERFNSQLWELYLGERKAQDGGAEVAAFRPGRGFLKWKVTPNYDGLFKGRPFRTNRWGMRDRDYSLDKPVSTYRFALVGSSAAMGSGVADDEVFEALIEDRLNREAAGGRYRRYEILNFSIRGIDPLERAMLFHDRALAFEPSTLLYVGQLPDRRMLQRHVADRIHLRIPPPFPKLEEVVRTAGLEPGMGFWRAVGALRAYRGPLLEWSYEWMVRLCRERGIHPVFVFLPEPTAEDPQRVAAEIGLARKTGFEIIDLSGVFDGYLEEELWLNRRDDHPNALGHRLIAERLYRELQDRRRELGLGVERRD